jgi:hypothetical protein
MKKMPHNPFQSREPNITGNDRIRTPQREAYAEMAKFASESDAKSGRLESCCPWGAGAGPGVVPEY